MYTFDYKDEQHQDHEPNGCSPVTSKEVEDTTGENEQVSENDEGQAALLSSVRVYAIADKYGIPLLKELAMDRFCDRVEINWTHEDFSDIVREIFQSTPDSDRGLRDIVVRIVATHAEALTQNDDFCQVLKEIGDLGLRVLCQTLTTQSKEASDSSSRIRELESEVEMLKAQLKESQRNSNRQASELTSTLSKINDFVECRHCKMGFNMEVEGGLFGGATVRCKGCRTRNYQE